MRTIILQNVYAHVRVLRVLKIIARSLASRLFKSNIAGSPTELLEIRAIKWYVTLNAIMLSIMFLRLLLLTSKSSQNTSINGKNMQFFHSTTANTLVHIKVQSIELFLFCHLLKINRFMVLLSLIFPSLLTRQVLCTANDLPKGLST